MEVQRPEPNGLVIARVSLSLFFENNPMHSSCQLLFFCWQRNAFEPISKIARRMTSKVSWTKPERLRCSIPKRAGIRRTSEDARDEPMPSVVANAVGLV